ncbi:hypothetical protein COV24_05005 [candidate division WWE3 bacterium CG10_big_fil_rev_8_21_14_0_10_32_10]|uniref:POTRA domain-containing protein n=1 Tax=candidate division WWE3 bacterium CG10_big_fil_rev_8_21_14_0_10_32_10 TaxID=1975090 RepID=A0A2H0RAC4_UNCKA|nr:MAG: hypothetical protein COV24_05005 [candidate division WWE3 bacterium CG10_big_fil_rev_8_21_14_0_10_32_10]
MQRFYFLFSIIFILLTLVVLYYKGYLNVYYINVSNRSDIQKYMQSTYTGKLFFLNFNKKNVEENVKKLFSDVEKIEIYRRYDFGLNVIIKEREPFAKNDDNIYISNNGFVYTTSRKYKQNLPLYTGNSSIGETVLSKDEIFFIKSLSIYPNFEINISNSKFVLNTKEGYYIEVSDNIENLKNMSDPLNKVLAKLKNEDQKNTNIVVLSNKIVLKN